MGVCWCETRTRLGGAVERGGVRGASDLVGRQLFQELASSNGSGRVAVDIGEGCGEGGREGRA